MFILGVKLFFKIKRNYAVQAFLFSWFYKRGIRNDLFSTNQNSIYSPLDIFVIYKTSNSYWNMYLCKNGLITILKTNIATILRLQLNDA